MKRIYNHDHAPTGLTGIFDERDHRGDAPYLAGILPKKSPGSLPDTGIHKEDIGSILA